MIIATAGHIDHGKTTLIKYLTGIDTDRLPEEKKRGISIEIGFAHYQTQNQLEIDFVDVPGHEKFIRNMLMGVISSDHLLLIIAADDGVMPQTIEHFAISQLLGIKDITVVLTKIDRVSPQRILEVQHEITTWLQLSGVYSPCIIPVSVFSKEGIQEIKQRLEEISQTYSDKLPKVKEFCQPRFVIDRTFSIRGTGTVVTGTLLSGEVKIGDTLKLSSTNQEVRIRKIQRHGKEVSATYGRGRYAFNLPNIESHQIHRGSYLLMADEMNFSFKMEVQLRILPSEKEQMKHWLPVHIHLGAGNYLGRIIIRKGQSIQAGEIGFAELRFDEPVHAIHGDHYIIRDQSSQRTIGGGVILNPLEMKDRIKKEQRPYFLETLLFSDVKKRILGLLDIFSAGLDLHWFKNAYYLSEEQFKQWTEQLNGSQMHCIVGKKYLGFSSEKVLQMQTDIEKMLKEHYQGASPGNGIEIQGIKKKVAPQINLENFILLLKEYFQKNQLIIKGGLLQRENYLLPETAQDQKMWQKIYPILKASSPNIPTIKEIADQTNLSAHLIREMMYRKVSRKELVKVTPERFMLQDSFVKCIELTEKIVQSSQDGTFTAATFRDTIGTGRNLAIEILECFDRMHITLRSGNLRHYNGDKKIQL